VHGGAIAEAALVSERLLFGVVVGADEGGSAGPCVAAG
jgi:hypothetical protein